MITRQSGLGAFLGDLKRRRVIRAAALYAVFAWVVVEVAATTLPYLLLPDWTVTLVIVLAIVGFPITIVLSWAFDVTPGGVERTEAASRLQHEEVEPLSEGGGRRRWRLLPASFASAAVLVAGAGLFFILLHPTSGESFEGRDWILIPDFENYTGDERFDGTLAAALRTSIQQSSFVNVVDPRRVADALEGLDQKSRDRLPRETALELAERLRAKAVLFGRIEPWEQGFALSTQIIDPLSGKPMMRTLSVKASQSETVLVALDILSQRIREALGETREAIDSSAVEIPMATTSSLQALRNWVEGGQAWREGRFAEAGKFFQLAVDRDSAFAMAHAALGGYYYYYEPNRPKGDEHIDIALRLVDRLTERERLLIESNAHSTRGNLDEAVTIRRVYVRKYPDDADEWYNLGTSLMQLKRCDEAIQALERSLELNPDNASAYINIATCHDLVGDYAAALEPYQRAFAIRPELRTSQNLNHEYGLTLMGVGDLEGARSTFELMLDRDTGDKARGHRSLALLAAYRGKYHEAVGHLKEAVQYNQIGKGLLSEYRNRLFLAAAYWVQGDEAGLGRELNAVWGLQDQFYIAPFWLSLAGQLFAWDDQLERARRNLALIRERSNEGNRIDAAAEYLVRGEILLAAGDVAGATEILSLAAKSRDDAVHLEPLARAQRLARDLDGAAAMYRTITEKPSLLWEAQQRWLYAHYWTGRLSEELGDTVSAVGWYRVLLELWADGDDDLPLRKDAEGRLTKLTQ